MTKTVTKGWGNEIIWASTEKYCGKLLNFKKDAKFSMHFHAIKDETWYVLTGKFTLIYIDTTDSTRHSTTLQPGDTWRNRPLLPHQLICSEEGTIIEVSTEDVTTDNYRIAKGDSQS